MSKIILVQLHSGGRVKYVVLTLNNATVHREWGLIDGKAQVTSNTYDYINKGKANELTPAQAAEADFYRLIDIKKKEGYIEVDDLADIPRLVDPSMDFNNIPVQFCCSKPYTSITEIKCRGLIATDDAGFFIKENGSCHFVLITDTGDVKLYTRRLDDHTRKYQKIVEAVNNMGLPPKTLLAVEFGVDTSNKLTTHISRFKRFQRISKSDTVNGIVKANIEKTLSLQEETPVVGLIFNVLFLNGCDYTIKSYRYIIDIIKDIVHKDLTNTFRVPKELKFSTYNEAVSWTESNVITVEGLVLWNMSENAEITYNGKPNRRACYKIKAVREDDVIAYDWQEGTGAKQGKVGSLLIGKYNKELTEIVPMGRVGSGLKIKQGECEIGYWDFPCVVEISYDQRFETGFYQFPRFNKKHEDKSPKDVIVDEEGF